MIYLYGLLDEVDELHRDPLHDLQGVTGPVAIARLESFCLIHGPAETDEILPKRRNLLAHARVLETLLKTGPVLPMRFGMFADDIAHVATMLAAQSGKIEALFAAIRDHSEYGIRISFPRAAALASTVADDPELAAERSRLSTRGATGRFEAAEFGRRLAERLDRRRAEAQRALVSELAPGFAAHVLRAPENDVQVLAVDALVADSRAAELATDVEAAARLSTFATGAEPDIRLVGPGPAYSFVDLTLAAEPAVS